MLARHTTLVTLGLIGLVATGCNDPKKKHRFSAEDRESQGGVGLGIGPNGNGNLNLPSNILQAINPTAGGIWGGDMVTLTGQDFTAGSTVAFDGQPATDVVVVSTTEITCKTPAHAAGVVDVTVTLPDGTVGRLNNAFTYDPNLGIYARVANYGDPTGEEQELLELMNRARRDPAAEGQRLGLDFSKYPPTPPLIFNADLSKAALDHTLDMAKRAFYGHDNPDGDGPNGRLLDTSYDLHQDFGTDRTKNYSENIGASNEAFFKVPQQVHDLFMRDPGLAQPKHREMMLGYGGHFPKNRELGIGYRTDLQGHPTYTHFITEEFARSKLDRPFVLGVVFVDQNPDGIAQSGEGEGGVTVTLSHASGFTISTQTAKAGGYGFEILRDGDFTITVNGQSTTVSVVDGKNVKVDFKNGIATTY